MKHLKLNNIKTTYKKNVILTLKYINLRYVTLIKKLTHNINKQNK